MENWIGIGIWIVIGVLMGLVMKVAIRRPDETSGHTLVMGALGAFAAVIGGMLGVGIVHFPVGTSALSLGGMAGAVLFAALMTWTYRWGIRGLI
jgi:ABC-type Co2+ transport system permease subunit